MQTTPSRDITLTQNGYAVKGWKLIDGKWYYFSTQGSYLPPPSKDRATNRLRWMSRSILKNKKEKDFRQQKPGILLL